jgi:hypothetical protein
MESKQKNYDTVSEAVNDLAKRGYNTDLSVHEDGECLICHQPSLSLSPDEFKIDEIHRFEGLTDPADEMIVFAISSESHQVKGTIVNAFGAYSDSDTSKIVQHLFKHI